VPSSAASIADFPAPDSKSAIQSIMKIQRNEILPFYMDSRPPLFD